MKILANEHVLAVHDLAASVAFYTGKLGFDVAWSDGSPDYSDGWCAVVRDGCTVRLGMCPGAAAPASLGDHNYYAYWLVDEVDAYHDEFAVAGVSILFPPKNQPWGRREFGLRTPDGHRILIGQELSGAPD